MSSGLPRFAPHAVNVDPEGEVAAVLSPEVTTCAVIDAVLAGQAPHYPPMPAAAYFNPETAAEYFLKVGE